MRVSVVVPAFNEEEAIGEVVRHIPSDLVDEVIVVDNGSTDSTAVRAREAGATVVSEPRRGYGAACHAGLMATKKGDVVVFLDGDNSDDPRNLSRLLKPLKKGEADFVLGSRLSGSQEPGAMSFHARLGNWFVARLMNRVYGLNITDIASFRAIRRDFLLSFGMEQMTFGWPVEMLVKAAKRRARIKEVPIDYHKRMGTSKVSGTIKGSLLAGYYMLWIPVRYIIKD
ncbi:MAG: glycosyltransferase [Proteobacteria bacterium]|nr:glycosyltransferase [Pseudomonadota bacterium]NIS71087.1 glycosyltransferase [Pseudomonadota bacterium]